MRGVGSSPRIVRGQRDAGFHDPLVESHLVVVIWPAFRSLYFAPRQALPRRTLALSAKPRMLPGKSDFAMIVRMKVVHLFALYRYVPFAIVLLSSTTLVAQEDRMFLAQLAGLTDRDHEKILDEAMHDWNVQTWFDVDLIDQRMKFTADQAVDRTMLAEYLAPYGFSVLSVGEPALDGTTDGEGTDVGPFPVYLNTGNDATDAQAYENAKRAWLATNPGWIEHHVQQRPLLEPEEQ